MAGIAQCRLGVNSHGSQTLVLHSSGLVSAFGYNNSGQVGDGTRQNPDHPTKVLKGAYDGTEFLGDDPANPVVAIAALYRHSLALTADGIVYGWGANNAGELGSDTLGNRFTPVRLARGLYNGTRFLGDNPTNPITAIAGGINNSVVLAKDGTLYGCGRNDFGQLGDGTTDDATAPVRVRKGEYPGATFLGDNPDNPVVALATGSYHTLALTKDGSLYAWGRNSNGQLGVDDTLYRTTPVRVLKGTYAGTIYLGDMPDNVIAFVRAGGATSLVMLADGTLMTWGDNSSGQLGNTNTDDSWTPLYVTAGEYPAAALFGTDPSRRTQQVSVGTSHMIALCEDGRVYGWGSNLFGSLGSDTISYSAAPVRVLRGEYPGSQFLGDNDFLRVRDVAAADEYSIAVVDTCDVYGWGHNQRLQLVESSLQDHGTPIRISGIGEEGAASVELGPFTAELNTYLVELRWQTLSEFRIARFEIQRRVDGSEWSALTSVPGQGNSSQPQNYSHDDDVSELLGSAHTLTYRLKYVGIDGVAATADSATVELTASGVETAPTSRTLEFSLSPAPASSTLSIQYYLPQLAEVHLELIDGTGHRVKQLSLGSRSAGTHRTTFSLEDLSSGIYICRITTDRLSRTCWLVVTK